jgi:hypothetical protein
MVPRADDRAGRTFYGRGGVRRSTSRRRGSSTGADREIARLC